MPLELRDCTFLGPALPEPFVKFQLEAELSRRKLLPRSTGEEGRALQERWEVYRRKLRALGEQGGDRRVASHVLEPLVERLGYVRFESQAEVITREGPEAGGWLLSAADGRKLRAWSVSLGTDLDAPSRRGRAYRFSASRVAQRVLLASGERVGLLTDGEELRLLLCDPARPDSHIAVRLDRAGGWRAAGTVPDSYRLLLALASPDAIAAVPELTEAARLAQSTVTKKLRRQARRAIEGFLQEVLDHPSNAGLRAEWSDPAALARALWREGLILVYRLLFVFKLESSADPARAFSFRDTSLWRNTYSPNTALARLVRRVLDQGADSGGFLECGLRALWRMFAEGMSSSELEVKPLGGMLFGEGATPLLERLTWGERGAARLLDALLWTAGDGKTERERVHYGALDVEDLGRVYEALLELEPGITTEPMCRLRRAKLEVVVSMAQGAPYRAALAPGDADKEEEFDSTADGEDAEDDEDETPKRRGKAAATSKTKVQFIEEIPQGRFFLRVGLGRKASGSYYTPHAFVRFLVQETLGPQLAERSPKEDPQPGRVLELKVLDPAMGSGHFLVEACRYLGEALYEACRLCDELAAQAEERAERAAEGEREALLARATELRRRVEDLPDPDDELVAYLPSRAAEGEGSGLSQRKAEALCRRLVAVHCLYGVDKSPLAVELAKLSLWLESYAEGMLLTFMDHRLLCGDSLTGPFFEHLLTLPNRGENLDDLFAQGLTKRLQVTLEAALVHVRDLEASVGKDVADLEQKLAAKERLDAALAPLKTLAAAWSGGVMLGDDCDAAYQALAQAVAAGEDLADVMGARPRLLDMVATGSESVAFQLSFPEVFARGAAAQGGFDAVLGNPPWDKVKLERKSVAATFEPELLRSDRKSEWASLIDEICARRPDVDAALASSERNVFHVRRVGARLYDSTAFEVGNMRASGDRDLFMMFVSRGRNCLATTGAIGMVLSGGLVKNVAARAVRQSLLVDLVPVALFHFHNRNRLFGDLPAIVEFSVALSQGKLSTQQSAEFRVGLNLDRFEHLEDDKNMLRLPVANVERTFGPLLIPSSPRNSHPARTSIGKALSDMGLSIGTDVHRTAGEKDFASIEVVLGAAIDDGRLPYAVTRLVQRGYVVVRDGRSIGQYDDLTPTRHSRWDTRAHLCVPSDRLSRSDVRSHFRLVFRETCGSPKTNERSMTAGVLPPGNAATHKSFVEVHPARRPSFRALICAAVLNSFPVDALLRPRIHTSISKALLHDTDWPRVTAKARVLLAHSATRLVCVHELYASLWKEQVGVAWREPTPKRTWPVLKSDDVRWAARAVIDAVVADAYGLDRGHYEHVLSTFSHKSYPKSPELCLAAFEELRAIGLDAFTKRHDPYWDIPLNESLPEPVIDLPIPGEKVPAQPNLGPLFDGLADDSAVATVMTRVQPPAAPESAWMARTPIDRQVLILSRVVDAHRRADRMKTLGNVKAEKIVYLIEAHAEIGLERQPVREAAGPADFPRLKKAAHRGAKLHAFSVRGGAGGAGGIWSPEGGLAKRVREYETLFAAKQHEIDRIVGLLVPMDSQQAEIVATLYACWNDILICGGRCDDTTLIDAFYGWSEGKRNFGADRLRRALDWMRQQGLVPTGKARPTEARIHEHEGSTPSVQRRKDNDGMYALVRDLLDARGLITSGDAQRATGLDAAGVRPYLKRLVDEGRAVTEGQRRGMKYRRANG